MIIQRSGRLFCHSGQFYNTPWVRYIATSRESHKKTARLDKREKQQFVNDFLHIKPIQNEGRRKGSFVVEDKKSQSPFPLLSKEKAEGRPIRTEWKNPHIVKPLKSSEHYLTSDLSNFENVRSYTREASNIEEASSIKEASSISMDNAQCIDSLSNERQQISTTPESSPSFLSKMKVVPSFRTVFDALGSICHRIIHRKEADTINRPERSRVAPDQIKVEPCANPKTSLVEARPFDKLLQGVASLKPSVNSSEESRSSNSLIPSTPAMPVEFVKTRTEEKVGKFDILTDAVSQFILYMRKKWSAPVLRVKVQRLKVGAVDETLSNFDFWLSGSGRNGKTRLLPPQLIRQVMNGHLDGSTMTSKEREAARWKLRKLATPRPLSPTYPKSAQQGKICSYFGRIA